jgi:hypothetical protein
MLMTLKPVIPLITIQLILKPLDVLVQLRDPQLVLVHRPGYTHFNYVKRESLSF